MQACTVKYCMPTILALETSSEIASVALFHRGRTLVRETAGVQSHSQSLLPMVQEVLNEAGLSLADCSAIAFGAGPGSFTGVRTACGVAQGLAFGADRPLVPVVTLLAVAEACRQKSGSTDFLPVLDARMGEVYWAQYRYEGKWEAIVSPTLSKPEAVLSVGSVLACGSGFAAYPAAWIDAKWQRLVQCEEGPKASAIASLGALAFSRGESLPARMAAPLYLRNKVALTIAERLAQTNA